MTQVVAGFFGKIAKSFGFDTAVDMTRDYLAAQGCRADRMDIEVLDSAERVDQLKQLRDKAIKARAVSAQRRLLEKTQPLMRLIATAKRGT